MGTIRPLRTIAQAIDGTTPPLLPPLSGASASVNASAETDDGLSVGRRFGHAHGTGSRMRDIASSDTHDGRPLS